MPKFIKFYNVDEQLNPLWINEDAILVIEPHESMDDSYIITVDELNSYRVRSKQVEEMLNLDLEPELLNIVRVERAETQNSSSPIWRCYDINGEQINFFAHEDEDKNTFPLINMAGYGVIFVRMDVGETIYWNDSPIVVYYKWNGKWREPVRVAGRDGDKPDDYEYEGINGFVQPSPFGESSLENLRGGLNVDDEDNDDKPIIW